ncbi:hypothetical protein SADUNF_Sadunf06G0048400 [Salix dunnii]|uniref:Uncharacterized protein n=1 Tax=Salix dunnii TaxID=1413687 RepID=A0A835MUV3_9ROSI|nr:hypothetical protein SADUNF_Sadunf06G0048400 [Salix dunnii]
MALKVLKYINLFFVAFLNCTCLDIVLDVAVHAMAIYMTFCGKIRTGSKKVNVSSADSTSMISIFTEYLVRTAPCQQCSSICTCIKRRPHKLAFLSYRIYGPHKVPILASQYGINHRLATNPFKPPISTLAPLLMVGEDLMERP